MIPIPTASNHTVIITIDGWLLEWVSKYPQPPHRVNNIDTEVSASCRELLSRTQAETLLKSHECPDLAMTMWPQIKFENEYS